MQLIVGNAFDKLVYQNTTIYLIYRPYIDNKYIRLDI